MMHWFAMMIIPLNPRSWILVPHSMLSLVLNFRSGNFGKVHLADDENLEIVGMGDINLKTSLGTIWTLKNVRYIPGLKRMLISMG